MDLVEVRAGHRRVTGLSGIVSVDGGSHKAPDSADRRRRSRQVERGPLLKLPKRDLTAEYEAEMAREQGDADLARGITELPDTVPALSPDPSSGAPSDTSIQSFVALFREITDFADTVYPGSRDDECEITVLVGREKLAFQVVTVDRDDP